MTLTNIILLMFAVPTAWWVSGFDPGVKGENRRRDFSRRLTRCLATVVLLWIFFWPNAVRVGYAFIPLILIIPPSVGILWAGCISAMLAQGIRRLIDSDDRRPLDPSENSRNLEKVAILLKSGRREEAVQLCESLKKSGSADMLVLETLLARAGVPQADSRKPRPLAEAHRLRSEGKFGGAETILQSLLAENPSEMNAALMLMQLYARDLRRSDKAAEVLRALEKQPDIPASHLEYARRSIVEWGQRKSAPVAASLPASVDELLAGGHLGTAVELLEQKTAEQPGDFGLWLKLAEAHAVHAGNFLRARTILGKIESNSSFSAEQIQTAKAKLAEWRDARPRREPVRAPQP